MRRLYKVNVSWREVYAKRRQAKKKPLGKVAKEILSWRWLRAILWKIVDFLDCTADRIAEWMEE